MYWRPSLAGGPLFAVKRGPAWSDRGVGIPRWLLFFLILAPVVAQGEWRLSLPGWEYVFPRDHGSHGEFKTEWWYFTGNVEAEGGERFGYQLTFFRQGVVPPGEEVPEGSRFVRRDMKFAHFAVVSIGGGGFEHFQRISRGVFGEAGFDDGARVVWIDDWECELVGEHDFRLRAGEDGVAIDLLLESLKGPVAHGSDGVSRKGEGEGRASHYYSLTRMRTSGTVGIGGRVWPVEGLSWFDHEWATNQLAAHQEGWDWFSLQFDDGSELMIFQIRTKDGGRDGFSSGTFVDAEGGSVGIGVEGFEMEPLRRWRSGKTGGEYPVAWRIRVPGQGLDLEIEAEVDGQELAMEPFSYWEGAVSARGTRNGREVRGRGYLEMTGYAGEIIGMRAEGGSAR